MAIQARGGGSSLDQATRVWMERIGQILGIPDVCMKRMKKRVEADADWSSVPCSLKRSRMRERVVTEAEKQQKQNHSRV